jgi:hypothetical protein
VRLRRKASSRRGPASTCLSPLPPPALCLFPFSGDGYSLPTLYARARGVGPTLLVVLDDSSAVFGGFAGSDWSGEETHSGPGAGHFARGTVGYLPSPSRYRTSDHWFGATDAFVFTLAPEFAAHRWTRVNSHWQLAKDECLAFGGGSNGGFGLWLDAGLERGTTQPTETFGNAPLTQGVDSNGFFHVVRVELWAFTDAAAGKGANTPGGAIVAGSKAALARAASSIKSVLRPTAAKGASGRVGPD